MTKKIENFIDNVIEEKKEQFKTMMGKEHKVENMIKDLKTLNLSNEKLEEVIKLQKNMYNKKGASLFYFLYKKNPIPIRCKIAAILINKCHII